MQKNDKKCIKPIKSEGLFSHDVVKIFPWNFSSVSGSSLEHLFKFAHIHGLTKLLGHSLDVVDIDEPGSIVVEQVEYFIDTVLY